MGHGERHRLQDGRMVHQRFIDLAWANFLAAAIDDLLQPPGKRQITVGVDDALIAGAEPAVDERLRIGVKRGFPTALPDDLDGRRVMVDILTRLASVDVFVNIVNQDDRSSGVWGDAHDVFLSMISRYKRHFLFLVFVLLATPLVAGLLMPANEVEFRKEGRMRSPTPSIPHSLDEVAALPKELDDYLGDRFGLRRQMIGWYANLTKRPFGEGSGQVLVGRHGRMFYLGNDAVRQSAGLVRRDWEVTETADFLAAMRNALAERGIRFLVASPPNSARIYQDDLPRWARSNGRVTEYDLLMADLAARGIKAVDLRPILWTVRAKAPPYLLYDTHWSPSGALAGFNAIAEADGHLDWRTNPEAFLSPLTQRRGGDLARMIGVFDDVAEPVREVGSYPRSTKVDLTDGESATYVETSEKQGETVMIIGDSFTMRFFPSMLLNHVRRLVWQHHKYCGFDWTLIDRFQPDEVWWMPTERYLLCSPNVRPEGFPGPQRTVIR
jgi:alginate O-acetyltransferase complex protein AlgJ